MATPIRRLALLALALLLTACGGAARQGTRSSSDDIEGQTSVRVENQAWFEINMFVERPGERIRLGQVPSQGTRVFRMPAGTTYGPIRFIADPVGSGRTAQTFEITVIPGDQVRLTIPNSAF